MDYVYSLSSSQPERKLELLVEVRSLVWPSLPSSFDLSQYFKRECRIWRRLDLYCHKNIVPLLGFIRPREGEALPTLVMPFYAGGDLSMFPRTYSSFVDLTVKVQLVRNCVTLYGGHLRSIALFRCAESQRDWLTVRLTLPLYHQKLSGCYTVHSQSPPAIHRDLKAVSLPIIYLYFIHIS